MSNENQAVQINENKSIAINFGVNVTKKALATLKRKYKKVPDFDTKEGYAEGKKSLSILTKTRTSLEVERKIQVAEAIKHQNNVNSAAGAIKTEIEAIEKPIREARKLVDDRKEREKREAEEKETLRVEGIEIKVAGIYAMTEGLLGADLARLEDQLAEAKAITITDDEYMEFVEPAKLAQNNVVATLTNAVESRRGIEEQEVAVKKQQDDLKEQQRKSNLKDSVQRIKMAPVDMVGKSVSEMETGLEKLNNIDTSDYGELESEAEAAIMETSQKLQAMIDQQKSVESQQADLDRERSEHDEMVAADAQKKTDDDRRQKEDEDALKARMPEDEKLRAYAEALGNVELPEIEDVQLKAVLVASLGALADIKEYIFDNTQSAK